MLTSKKYICDESTFVKLVCEILNQHFNKSKAIQITVLHF